MIDWNKPVETVDGREAKIIGRSPYASCGTVFLPMIIWVSPEIPGCVGNVFLVNNEGIRCDDRTVYSGRQEPIIRNVKVKKEGWVAIYAGQESDGTKRCSYIYETLDEVMLACGGNRLVSYSKVTWEE
jgi:hypothetical protein